MAAPVTAPGSVKAGSLRLQVKLTPNRQEEDTSDGSPEKTITLKHKLLMCFEQVRKLVISLGCFQVCSDKNIGDFLWEVHGKNEGKQLQFAKA